MAQCDLWARVLKFSALHCHYVGGYSWHEVCSIHWTSGRLLCALLFSVLKDRILQSVQHSPQSRTFSVLQRISGSADVLEKRNLKANSHMPCRAHAAPMPFPCRSPAMPCLVNSHMSCPTPAFHRQCRVLRGSPRGSRKYPNCWSYSLTDWYASDNNLRGTPRGSRKKLNAGRSPTCHIWIGRS
jgi:hypothetical protein